jgi:molybdopterin-guanine dinucleotide biosynthesis protein A
LLAGGASRRLGGIPKGLELVGQSRIIDHVRRALEAVTPDLLLVANDPGAAEWQPGVALLSDVRPGAGGLAGIETALGTGRDALVVAWDMPFVAPELLAALAKRGRSLRVDAVVPESESPHGIEPFCAFYSARLLPALAGFLAGGGRAAHDFLNQTDRIDRMPLAEVKRFGDPPRLFFSVNTADDLARARALAAAQ